MAAYSFESSRVSTSAGWPHPEVMVCLITATTDAETGKAVLEWTLKAGSCSNTLNYVTFSNVLLEIDGVAVYTDTTQGQHSYNSDMEIATGSITVDYEEDGTKTVPIRMEAGIYNWAVNSTYSGEMELETITRGLIYIDMGNGPEAFAIDIDSGTGWCQYAADVDEGSAWNACS